MTLRRQIAVAAALLGLTALAILLADGMGTSDGAGASKQGDNGGQGRERSPPAVLVETVVLEPEVTRLEAVGTGRAIRSATLFPAVAGEVVAIAIEADAPVAEGDVLLELDSRAEELAVELARVRVKNARQLLDRYERTKGSGAVPATTIDTARTDLEAATIQLRQAEVARDDRRVVAPFAGHTGLSPVDVGDRIGPDQQVTTLDDRSALLIGFDIPEALLDRVAIGQPVTVQPWSRRGGAVDGTIFELGSRIDPASRSLRARARVDNPHDHLRPGMSFAVTMNLTGRSYPLVPEIAVQWGTDGPFLWTVRDGLAERVAVRIVQRRDGRTMVDAPLEAGAPVVVEGVQRLRSGQAARIAERPETPS